MAYTETTSTSYGARLGNSLKGIVSGFVLLAAGTALLFWNEGNFVKTQKALEEGQSVVVSAGDVSTVKPELNGKFVHATALADTQDVLTDEMFGVSERAVALKRSVEYYQWIEHSRTETKDKIGGGQEQRTTYTYSREWTNQPVNSSSFKDAAYQNKNFVLTEVPSKLVLAQNVSFGGYRLPEFIIASIQGNTPVKVELTPEKKQEWETMLLKSSGQEQAVVEQAVTSVAAAVSEQKPEVEAKPQAESSSSANAAVAAAGEVSVKPEITREAVNPQTNVANVAESAVVGKTEVNQAESKKPAANPVAKRELFHVNNDGAYIGLFPANPEVGDVRIKISKTEPSVISILAKVNGSTFERYMAQNGKDISLVMSGEVSAENMFASAHSSNSTIAWVLRVVGTLLVIVALKTMFSIVVTIFKVLPFLSSIVGAGVGIVVFVIGVSWSLLVVASAWLFYRPLIAGVLIALVIAAIWFLKNRAKAKQATVNPTPAVP